MKCSFCDEKIEMGKLEWILISKKPTVSHYCSLGCLSGHVDEKAIEAEEKNGLIN
ncbi:MULTISPECIES: hypothetical protein [Bacillales]|uniref:hypothetical protein n=1 Tax=Bacillales TaxID=1385 RepID=UPI000349EAED|nr:MULTISPECIES: hypothetical protein [Bacillales]